MVTKNKPVKKEKKVPPGQFPIRTDADLDRLSVIAPSEIEKAKVNWRRTVPAKYKNLLDAEVKPSHATDN